jgi:hypothetical protein
VFVLDWLYGSVTGGKQIEVIGQSQGEAIQRKERGSERSAVTDGGLGRKHS